MVKVKSKRRICSHDTISTKDEIESQYKKAKNRTERDKLRSIGRNIRSLFLEDATRVTQGVENQEKKLGLPSLYRQLTPSETHYLQ